MNINQRLIVAAILGGAGTTAVISLGALLKREIDETKRWNKTVENLESLRKKEDEAFEEYVTIKPVARARALQEMLREAQEGKGPCTREELNATYQEKIKFHEITLRYDR